MRMASATSKTKILPSPIFPVRAENASFCSTSSHRSSATTISSLILGSRSTLYSCPRYTSLWPFCRPCPRTSEMVMPSIPMDLRASLTSSSLNGWMMASIFFMASGLEYITFLAVHAEVEPFGLGLLGHAQSDHNVADLQDNERADQREQPG